MSSKNISENFSKESGQRLRDIRKKLGLSPESAAAKANVSAQQWRKYERGEAEPKISKMIFLFQEKFSLEWLMTGQGPMQLGEAAPPVDQDDSPKGIIEEWVQDVREKEGHDGRIVMELSLQVPEFREWYKEKKSKSGGAALGSAQENVA